MPAVRGYLTVHEALRRLLQGRRASAVFVEPAVVRIVPAAPALAKRPPRKARVLHSEASLPAAEDNREIVVTATKRAVPMSAFAGAVTVIGGDDPALASGVRGNEALVARLPGLTSTHFGPGRNKLFIRGIADSGFNGVTQSTVGQYLGEMRLSYSTPDPDLRLYDIERVEILAGPQGTLYGAGALGGIIRIVPNAPSLGAPQASTSLGLSLTQHGAPGAELAAVADVALAEDKLGLRLVGYALTEGGYIDDLRRGLDDVNRTRIAGGRAVLRARPGSDWTIDLGMGAQEIEGQDAQYADRDAPRLARRSAVRQDFGNSYLIAHGTAAKTWDDLRFVGTLGFTRHRMHERYDTTIADEEPSSTVVTNRSALSAAEVRLSQGSDGRGWLLGGSVTANFAEQVQPEMPRVDAGTRTRTRIVDATGFGEGTLAIMRNLSLTLGARISHVRLSSAREPLSGEPRSLYGRAELNRTETRLLPSAALAAKLRRDLLLFLRYQRGFRPGGLDGTGSSYRSDRVAALEGGVRYGRPDLSGIEAALSFAYTRWDDVQADVYDSVQPRTINLGDGRIYSVDARLGLRLTSQLSVRAGAVFNESEITTPAPELRSTAEEPTPKSRLPHVADVNGYAAAEYRAALSSRAQLRLSATARYVGKSRLGVGAQLGVPGGAEEDQGNWLDLSLVAQAEAGRHRITFGVTNLLDIAGNRFALGSPNVFGSMSQLTPLRPRTINLSWQQRF